MAVGVERTTQRIRISDTHILVPNRNGEFMIVSGSATSKNLKQASAKTEQENIIG